MNREKRPGRREGGTEGEHPALELVRLLVNVPGWTFIDDDNPPPAPPGFELETRDDGFLGFVTHYRHLPLAGSGGHVVELDSSPLKCGRST